MWISIADESSKLCSDENFWSSAKVFVERPHILNRRLLGVDILRTFAIIKDDSINLNILNSICENYRTLYEDVEKGLSDFRLKVNPCNDIWKDRDNLFLQQRTLLPKDPKFTSQMEFLLIDKKNKYLVFFPDHTNVNKVFLSPNCIYRILLKNERISLQVLNFNAEIADSLKPSIEWLKTHVHKKIVNWAHSEVSSSSIPSLSLVSIKQYSQNYHKLKLKYGPELVQMWTECTDPLKYVYEDIAIAAYLMTLWQAEALLYGLAQKQSFADLGCGNGLLVYILSMEGYPGIGLDLRKRKIWDHYGPHVTLKETSITPSDEMLFPDCDWLIGNHSDELTPWIPVIAARSSYKMKMFLLPCCAYTFNGKYHRENKHFSQYQSYLNFVKEICIVMGFNVQQDRLRIPSTKRTCFVCSSRTYKIEEESKVDRVRTEFIQKALDLHNKIQASNSALVDSNFASVLTDCESNKVGTEENSSSAKWLYDFQPREKLEKVRNCSTLDKLVMQKILLKLVNALLKAEENYQTLITDEIEKNWNCGGILSLKDLVSSLDYSELQELKNQCGGLQTVLRNHRNIFTVCKDGVTLSYPSNSSVRNPKKKSKSNQKKESQIRIKPCWFYYNHPQGCPLSSKICTYIHEDDDISAVT